MNISSQSGTIVVPWDLSDSFRPAIERAFEITGPECIYLLHIIRPASDDGYGVLWDTLRHNRIATTRAREAFHRESIRDARLRDVRFAVQFGELASTINDYARQVNAGLIILPPPRRSILRRLLSVPLTESIARDASCPVLIVHDDSPEVIAERPQATSNRFATSDPMVPAFGPTS